MKLKALFFWISLASCQFVISQYEITIDAYILNQETKQAVPYVNVGFLEKGIGTVSQSDGRFVLQYDERNISDNDVLQISSIGYKSITLTAKKLYDLLLKDNKIYIEPDVFALEQATVIAEKRKKMTIGADHYSKKFMGYWKQKKALGGEIASPINIRKKNTKLEKLKFYVLENSSDSLLVRVNVYKEQKRKPGLNILTSNIYHTIVSKSGEETIDLSRYNVVVNDDIIVSLELVKVYGDDIGFAICGIFNGMAYVKYISQDSWKQGTEVGIAFKMDISYPASSNKPRKREKPENITLYWDTSLSRSNSDLELELDFLKKYLSKIREAKVTFVPFSDTIQTRKTFDIKRGKSKSLISEIQKQRYHGASNFTELFKELEKPDQYVVVTDGLDTYGDHEFAFGPPGVSSNRGTRANNNTLQNGSISSDGYYINLSKVSRDTALGYILNDIEDRSIYNADTSKGIISGTVFSKNNIPIQGCKISVKGSLIEAETNTDGEFAINAEPQDILVFRSFGMITKSMAIDPSEKMTVLLTPKYNILDQVTIKANKEREALKEASEFELKKRKAGYPYHSLSKEEFPASAFFLPDLIKGRFPGVQTSGFGSETTYSVRLGPPLFLVDGAAMAEPPNFLLASQIENITLITSAPGRARYGPVAGAGVFLITTSIGDTSELERKEKSKPSLLVQGNEYKDSYFLLNPNLGRPDYLNNLWESDSYANAKNIYFSLLKNRRLEIPFYIHSADYFKRWNIQFSDQILSNLAELSIDNYSVLRTLAFYLEERKDKEKALLIYDKIIDLKPNYAQSYLDLARIYKENSRYKESFELYKKILSNDDKDIDFSEISLQAESQLQHLLNHHRTEVSYTDVPNKFLVVKSVPIRIVFDWNDPQAEFELQFVNPQKKFYKWSHIFEENQSLLSSHIKNGVTSKEFIMDESFPGEWIINVQSFGEASKRNPTFLKYTIYRNYGLDTETKNTKVIKLYNQEQKVTLDKFVL